MGPRCLERIQTPGQGQNRPFDPPVSAAPAPTRYRKPVASTIPFVSGADQSPGESPIQSSLELEEYRQLRATIRERGSLRVILFIVTIVAWAFVAAVIAAVLSLPLASLLSLIVLMAGFEAVHALHISVERIGRYLYARYESVGGEVHSQPRTDPSIHVRHMWEGTIAQFGAGHRSSTRPADSLFSLIFVAAVLVNFLAAALGASTAELIGVGALHALVIVRILASKRAARGQRAEDGQRFHAILK